MSDTELRLYEEELPRLHAEWDLLRGDTSGMDESQIFELAKAAYPENLERARSYASNFMAARLEASMKQV